MTIDLDGLSEKELKVLRGRVDRALATLETRRLDDARRAVEEAAREHGFSLSQLLEGKGIMRRGAVGRRPIGEPKYRNPANPEQTWTGRGRQPGWIREGLARGMALGDFSI